MCAIERHPDSGTRDSLTHTLFNLIKRPDEQQRRIIMDVGVSCFCFCFLLFFVFCFLFYIVFLFNVFNSVFGGCCFIIFILVILSTFRHV